MPVSDVQGISLDGITRRCQQESENFFHRRAFDPRYCFELFRRAFLLRDELAWDRVYHQYRRLVLSWIERDPLFSKLDEEPDYFINRAFEKMWAVITPVKFADFNDLKSILRYLQLCVHSCMVDHVRARSLALRMEEETDPEREGKLQDNTSPPVEQQVTQQMEARALWDWLDRRLKSEVERRVIYGMFVLALKPREIADAYRGLFQSVDEIYTVKENVMARLRRDPELAQVLGRWGEGFGPGEVSGLDVAR